MQSEPQCTTPGGESPHMRTNETRVTPSTVPVLDNLEWLVTKFLVRGTSL